MSINAVNTTPSAAVPLSSVPASSTSQAGAVSSTSSSTPVSSSTPSTPTPAPAAPADQVTISAYGQRAAQFIQEARALPTQSTPGLNADQLKQLKQQLDEGKYPPQGLTEGLLSLIGSSLISADGSN